MAIGGSLRAALRAGNWAKTAMESRRRARALADLNARGGIRGSREMASPAARGFNDEFGGGSAFGPGGRTVLQNHMTGAREVPHTLSGYGGGLRNRRYYDNNPIQAPYEGFRVWPGRTSDGFPRTFDAPPPWMGRGTPPPVQRTAPRSFYDEPLPFFYDDPLPIPRFEPTPAQLDAHYRSLWNQWNF